MPIHCTAPAPTVQVTATASSSRAFGVVATVNTVCRFFNPSERATGRDRAQHHCLLRGTYLLDGRRLFPIFYIDGTMASTMNNSMNDATDTDHGRPHGMVLDYAMASTMDDAMDTDHGRHHGIVYGIFHGVVRGRCPRHRPCTIAWSRPWTTP